MPQTSIQARRSRRRPSSWLLVAVALVVYGLSAGNPTAVSAAGSFTVSGSGWGHAVGMSQWGARGRAAHGSKYSEILRAYYSGTAIGTHHPSSSNVRVLLAEKQSSITLTARGSTAVSGLGSIPAGQQITATRSGAGISITGAFSASTIGEVQLNLGSSGGPVTVSSSGNAYRYGVLRLSIDPAGGLRAVVGGMTMQQYLYGLGEMPSSWPIEALKAQATAARTYAQKQIGARAGNPKFADFDLYASTSDQSYRGIRFEPEPTNASWRAAVDATAEIFVLHSGRLIDAVYSASSGGHTEDSEWVWTSRVDYLRGVDDPYDTSGGNPSANWAATFADSEVGSWFGVGSATSIQVLGAPRPSGHLDKSIVRITGTTRTRDVTGATFRNTVNANAGQSRQIRSTRFVVGAPAGPGSPGQPTPNLPPVPAPAPPPPPPTPPPPPPPRTTMVSGNIVTATANGRTVIIAGNSVDPDGAPLVRVVSTMGSQRAVRDYRSTNGKFLLAWAGSPGTRTVCVTLYDTPTNKAVSLGCRQVVVK